jgi:hypothetical protein
VNLRIIAFGSPSVGGNSSRHVPKPRTIISMKCLDTLVLIPIRITRLLRLEPRIRVVTRILPSDGGWAGSQKSQFLFLSEQEKRNWASLQPRPGSLH